MAGHRKMHSFCILFNDPIRRFLLCFSILLLLIFLSPSAQSASCLPLPSDAAHWWRAEGNAQDSIGLNHGALEGGTLYETGKVGQGFSFDGVDDLVAIPADGFPTGASDRTLEAWVKIDALVAQEAYFAGYGLFGAMGASYNIGASFGRLYFSSWGPDLFGPQVALGQWHHVAVTNVGSLVTLYLDGVPVNSASLPIDVPPEGTQFFIGKVGGEYGDIRRLQGQVDEVSLYTRALTPEEISAIYQAGALGKCAPESPTNHPPVLSFSQETGYVTDGVNPDKGTANLTPLAFKVIYTDQDNDPPQSLLLHIDTGTVNLDLIALIPDTGDAVPSILKDGIFSNGEQYTYTRIFPKGNYQYHFETSDTEAVARLPASGELTFETGYSNVAFLPGIKASKLYKFNEDPGCIVNCENQFWNPNRNEDVEKLFLDDNGKSQDQTIYTRDIIDTIIPYTYDIYRTFNDSLDELSSEGIQWKALPYDWRLDFGEVVDGGVVSGNGNINYNTESISPYIINEIEILASQSLNGKVTIITHSIGGLIAKTLLQKLEAMKDAGVSNLIDKIDRLILVASPQLGTPRAAAALLHGDDEELCKLGICLIKQDTAREFGEHMPSAYSLLPSPEYFQRVESPVIEFDIEVNRIYGFPHIYEFEIANADDFYKFLRGDDGARQEPDADDTDSPNVVKSNLLAQAQAIHIALDSWTPPSHIEVTQIAGWGLDTIRGIRYDDCDVPGCPQMLSHLERELLMTEDGDGTVVTPSAVAMNARKFYIDLLAYNADHLVNRNHAGILEVEEVQELIKRTVENNLDLSALPGNIGLIKPIPVDSQKKLRIRGLSPISIDVYDTFGSHTGPVPNSNAQLFEFQIPNSYYYKIGEKAYLGLDTRDQYRIEIDGLALGSFTLEIDEVFNDEVIDTTAYNNISITSDTKASLTTQTVDTTSSLSIDFQGDGTPDMIISPSEQPDPKASLQALKAVVNTLTIQKAVKNAIMRQIEAAEKVLDRGFPKIADGILKGLIKQLQGYPEFLISPSDAQALIQIIEVIRLSLIL